MVIDTGRKVPIQGGRRRNNVTHLGVFYRTTIESRRNVGQEPDSSRSVDLLRMGKTMAVSTSMRLPWHYPVSSPVVNVLFGNHSSIATTEDLAADDIDVLVVRTWSGHDSVVRT